MLTGSMRVSQGTIFDPKKTKRAAKSDPLEYFFNLNDLNISKIYTEAKS